MGHARKFLVVLEAADELAAALASAGTAVIPDMHIAAAISTVVIFLSLIFILSFRFAKRIFVVPPLFA